MQLIQFPKGLEDVAFLEMELKKIADTEIPFASPKALILLKLYAGSPLDLQDAQQIAIQNDFSSTDFESIKKLASKLRVPGRLKKLTFKIDR